LSFYGGKGAYKSDNKKEKVESGKKKIISNANEFIKRKTLESRRRSQIKIKKARSNFKRK
jgi:hypothetical protein